MKQSKFRAMILAGVIGTAVIIPISTGTASAATATSKCANVAAGYTPLASGNASGYTFDGRLTWNVCISQDSTGRRYASAELSSPSGVYKHDRFNGAIDVYLQGCYAKNIYSNLVSGSKGWGGTYDVGVLASGRYYFTRVFTGFTTSKATNGYRVRVHTGSGVVVPRTNSFLYALSSAGPNGQADYYGPCQLLPA
jgi:hypothetical protein